MAVTNTRVTLPYVPGANRMTVTDVTLDSSYVTGGEPVSAADLGLSSVEHSIAVVKTAGTGSVTAANYIAATGLLICYTAAAQVGSTVDVSAVTIQVTAWGK